MRDSRKAVRPSSPSRLALACLPSSLLPSPRGWLSNRFLENGSLYIRRTLLYIPHYSFKEAEPKTAKSRRKIVLSQFVIDVLRRHRTAQLEARLKAGAVWTGHDLVFCDKHGEFLQPMALTRQFSRLLEEMG